MAKVDCVDWPGCKCWFWSRDHLEPHFHVQSPGEWEIRVFFGDDPPRFDVLWELQKVPGKMLRKFLAQVAEHREGLFVEWDAKVQVDDP
jgi:hypothetical protein